jgi:hypothetical protein
MKRAVLWLVFCLVVNVPTARAQELSAEDEEMFRRSRIRTAIEADISVAEEKQTKGLLLFGGGLAIELVSIVAFFPSTKLEPDPSDPTKLKTTETGNPPLFYGGILLGSVVSLWGAWTWIDGYSTAQQLKVKKYDFGLMQKDGHNYVAMQRTF